MWMPFMWLNEKQLHLHSAISNRIVISNQRIVFHFLHLLCKSIMKYDNERKKKRIKGEIESAPQTYLRDTF